MKCSWRDVPLDTLLLSHPVCLLELDLIVTFTLPNRTQGPSPALSAGALHAVPEPSKRLYPGVGAHDSPGGGSV